MAGRAEIGYGTMPAMQNKGYMTEAVKGLLRWAAARKDIQVWYWLKRLLPIFPSIRVVEKNGFEQMGKMGKLGENLYWRKLLGES